MGTDPNQALTLICDYDKSKFYIVSVDTTDLKTIEVPADIEWAMIVAYHRGRMEMIKGTPLYEKYAPDFPRLPHYREMISLQPRRQQRPYCRRS